MLHNEWMCGEPHPPDPLLQNGEGGESLFWGIFGYGGVGFGYVPIDYVNFIILDARNSVLYVTYR